MLTKTYTQRKKKHKTLNLDDACLRCGLYEHTTKPKLDRIKIQDGPAGIVMIVLGTPTRMAEARGDIAHDAVSTVVKQYTKKYLQDCEVWITSSVKCYPNDWSVKTHEARWCSTYLDKDIKETKPIKVIAMGDIARMTCKEIEQEYESCVHPLQLKEGALPRTIVEAYSRTGKELRNELGKIPWEPRLLPVMRQALREQYVGLDFEWNPETDVTHTVGFSSSTSCHAIPLCDKARHLIKRLVSNEDITIVGHNIISDVIRIMKWVRPKDIKCRFMDTLVLKRQLASHLPVGGLKFFAHSYLYLEDYAKDITLEDYNEYSEKLRVYCAGDAYVGVLLYQYFKDKYKDKWDVMAPARDIDMDMILPVADMIKGGIAVDETNLNKMTKEIDTQVDVLLEELSTEYEINPSSPTQVLDKCNELGFNIESTGEAVLKKINHAFTNKILEYRKYSKLATTYTTKIPEWLSIDGRLHCNLHLASTVTGRMTSSKPNMQNVPPKVRPCFQSIFGEDGILMTVDASQSELRCLAYLANSKYLIDSYNKGIDMHTLVAQLAGIDRRDAKTLNFAYVYGASDFRMQQELVKLGKSMSKAKKITQDYIKSMQKLGIADYQRKLLTKANQTKYNTSIYGRIGERLNPTQVVNFPVQSFSADLNKIRIIQMYDKLRENNLLSRIWLEFHDAMELDIHVTELDKVIELIKSLDTRIPDMLNKRITLDLPIDIKYENKNWN